MAAGARMLGFKNRSLTLVPILGDLQRSASSPSRRVCGEYLSSDSGGKPGQAAAAGEGPAFSRKDTSQVLQDGDVPDVVVEGVHGVVAVETSVRNASEGTMATR